VQSCRRATRAKRVDGTWQKRLHRSSLGGLHMIYLSTFFLIGGLYLIAAASPGPNFFIISQLSLAGERHRACLVAAGITAGSTLWASSAMAGLAALLLHLSWLSFGLKLRWCCLSSVVRPQATTECGEAGRRSPSRHPARPNDWPCLSHGSTDQPHEPEVGCLLDERLRDHTARRCSIVGVHGDSADDRNAFGHLACGHRSRVYGRADSRCISPAASSDRCRLWCSSGFTGVASWLRSPGLTLPSTYE
jgi:LysE type translocator